MTTLTDVRFDDLQVGQKFTTYDTDAVFVKKDAKQAYCAVFAPAGWFNFYTDDIVRAFTGVALEGASHG